MDADTKELYALNGVDNAMQVRVEGRVVGGDERHRPIQTPVAGALAALLAERAMGIFGQD